MLGVVTLHLLADALDARIEIVAGETELSLQPTLTNAVEFRLVATGHERRVFAAQSDAEMLHDPSYGCLIYRMRCTWQCLLCIQTWRVPYHSEVPEV